MGVVEKNKSEKGRFSTNEETKRIVWIQAAGHCELCGTDLTYDYRVGKPMRWGEVAHIMPASPKGPRADNEHDETKAEALTNNSNNLMLLCPNCHDRIDRDADGYPESDLTDLHQAYLMRIKLAATTPDGGRAIPVIVQSQHFATTNEISTRDLLMAMSAEGLTAIGHEIRIIFPPPGPRGRDKLYWQQIKDSIQFEFENKLRKRGGSYGDMPTLAIVGLADIPALILLGQSIGDRSKRLLFSANREHGLKWPDTSAAVPKFVFSLPPEGTGPIALILSVSAQVPKQDIIDVLEDARVAEFSIPEPSYMVVKNRSVIHEFRNALQVCLSQLEAITKDPIHVFAAVPAALAIEFGALLTTEHQHPYRIYDRSKLHDNAFIPTLSLGLDSKGIY